MTDICRGSAYTFGDNINTDIISPPQYMELSPREAAKYAMSAVDPDFASTIKPGDIVVAGNNFGSGSSRETAPLALLYLQVGAIVARFFARIFYRNAINLGIPAVECGQADQIRHGDLLVIDFVKGVIDNQTQKTIYQCSQLPPHILNLIQEGGLIAHLKKELIAAQ
jgi:3-isopropylmalate/(R)-2-methylmalate dehydratase small subunit